jgi:hypothetical protein
MAEFTMADRIVGNRVEPIVGRRMVVCVADRALTLKVTGAPTRRTPKIKPCAGASG